MNKTVIIVAAFIFLILSQIFSTGTKEVETDDPEIDTQDLPQTSEVTDSRPFGYNPDLLYDPDYQVDVNVNEISGYKVIVEESGNPFAMFFDKENENWNIATYNYERQFWFWKFDHFESDIIDLEKLYLEIDLTKTNLNRTKPDILSFLGYLTQEDHLYDYSADEEFGLFINYLNEYSVSESQQEYYLFAANNPAKRGAVLPQVFGRFYEESEVGIQFLNLTANYSKFPELAREFTSAGGMELFFQLHDFKAITSFKGATYTFRENINDNKPIPLIIVEIYPLDGIYSGTLEVQEFSEKVELYHEQKFRSEFDVSVVQLTIDYDRFVGEPGVPYQGTQFKMDALFDEYIHSRYGEDKLYMYYFTDKEEYKKIDDSPSHPRIFGAYLTDWDENKITYFHELGHVLSLRHHFPGREYAYTAEAHISVPCIMNYDNSLRSEEFCPLCSYSLGISPLVADF